MSDASPLSQYFAIRAQEYPQHSAPHEIATAISKGELTTERRRSVVAAYGLESDKALRAILLEWIIDYARHLLTQRPLASESVTSISGLNRMLGIEEGDFFSIRPAEVKALLCEQLEAILEDSQLEEHEELAQSKLQGVFGLSYDQYLVLTRSTYEVAIEDARNAIAGVAPSQAAVLRRRVQALESVCLLAARQSRSLGGLR